MNKLIFVVFVICIVTFNEYCESRQISRTTVTFKNGVKEAILESIKRCNMADKVPGIIKLIQEGSYVEDEYFRTFIHCGYKESGYAHENGRIKLEAASQAFAENNDAMLKTMKDCDKLFPDPVTTTFEYFKCFQDNTPYLMQF